MVRDTSEAIVDDTEVQDQWHRVRRIRQISHYLHVPTILSPDSNHLLSFCCMCCAKKVRKLTNRPVVSLLES